MSDKNLTGGLKWPKSEYHRDFLITSLKRPRTPLTIELQHPGKWSSTTHILYVEIKLQMYPFSIIINDENQTDIQSITPGSLGPDGAMFDSF